MGMVRWTGEGFKLVGKLLTNETFEEWFQTQGKELAQGILKSMTAKWFFGNARVRRQAKKAVLSGVNSSKPLQMALNDSLNKLPRIVQALALAIEKQNVAVLTKAYILRKLVIVPRAAVVNDFTLTLLEDLGNAAELKRFQGFPDYFLRKQASETERALCDQLLREDAWALVGERGIILGADDQFDWHLKNIRGHYYYGYEDITDLTKRSARKDFLAKLKPWLDEKMVQLGKLTSTEIDDIGALLFNKS